MKKIAFLAVCLAFGSFSYSVWPPQKGSGRFSVDMVYFSVDLIVNDMETSVEFCGEIGRVAVHETENLRIEILAKSFSCACIDCKIFVKEKNGNINLVLHSEFTSEWGLPVDVTNDSENVESVIALRLVSVLKRERLFFPM